MNSKNILIIGFIGIILFLGVFTLSKNSNPGVSVQQNSDTVTDNGTVTTSGNISQPIMNTSTLVPDISKSANNIITIEVKGSNYKFALTEIKVKKGDRIKINFVNTGGLHDFVIDEFNVKTKQIKDSETDSVEFTADKTGTFEYYCSVGKHREMGMVGKLIVE